MSWSQSPVPPIFESRSSHREGEMSEQSSVRCPWQRGNSTPLTPGRPQHKISWLCWPIKGRANAPALMQKGTRREVSRLMASFTSFREIGTSDQSAQVQPLTELFHVLD